MLLLAILFIGYGLFSCWHYLVFGSVVLKTGAEISGISALMTAISLLSLGFYILILYLKERKHLKEQVFKIQNIVVKVIKMNKVWGVIQSVVLEDEFLNQYTFYCSSTKVASSVLSEFVISQQAQLNVINENGMECSLESDTAAAYGIIRVENKK